MANENQQPNGTEDGVDLDQTELERSDAIDPVIQTHINEDGTTSNYFDKRKLKIAPRSTLQFKVGPPFELVGNYNTVIDTGTSETVSFQITPRIDRGFDFIDDEWVGYKRNYFTLVSAFETPGLNLQSFLNSSFEVQTKNCNTFQNLTVKYFAIKINARSDDDHTEISLVQHTAKRDKGPQFTPATCPLIPSELPQHQIIREASNVRNSNKMRKYDSTFYFHRDKKKEECSEHGVVRTYPEECIQKVARYERVQFASSINVKKPTQQNRHFRLHVILGAVVCPCSNYSTDLTHLYEPRRRQDEVMMLNDTKEIFVPLQEMRTPPLIIRGRSPSNYTSSQRVSLRTNSSFNMGKKEPSLCSLSTNSGLTSQPSTTSSIISSPIGKRVGRPAKRKSKVNDFTSITNGTEMAPGIQNRKSKRVQTIEQIERMYNEGSSLDLRTSNEANKCHYEQERNNFKRTKLSRHNSIDPREIELKPPSFVTDENSYLVGSLALTATLKSQRFEKNNKRRRLDNENASTITETQVYIRKKKISLLSPTASASSHSSMASSLTNSPVEKIHHQNTFEDYLGNELNSLSLSLLEETSSNYYHISNGLCSEDESIPRSFSRVIGETSFTNLYNYKQEKVFIKESISTRDVSGLPSQIVDDGDLFEELSFYRH